MPVRVVFARLAFVIVGVFGPLIHVQVPEPAEGALAAIVVPVTLHRIWSAPALELGARKMTSVMLLFAFRQGAALYAVRVRLTLPAEISAALGVYTGLRAVALLKVPVPDVVQRRLV
jgi:hypothetical protein